LLPGIALCFAIVLAARLLQALEERLFEHPYIEALVGAILLGAAIRVIWEPGDLWRPGIRCSAGTLLEVAVVLLGLLLDLRAMIAGGPALPLGIAGVVALSLVGSYGVSRAARLPHRMAVLIACGNSICGNSAIAAVASVIGATGREIASAIAFTAILGVVVVLALPLLVPVLDLSAGQYGVLAGLTVYAVPQVLAATAPFGSLSMQVGTLVKLLRVLMLGPVVLLLSVGMRGNAGTDPVRTGVPWRPGRFIPWFIIGFLLAAVLNSMGLVPQPMLKPLQFIAGLLTTVAMAALGLGVDLRSLARIGPRVTLAVAVSLLLLIALSLGAIRFLGLA
jgi:uncharacterized integral membrane protein (TIGR00698 family)